MATQQIPLKPDSINYWSYTVTDQVSGAPVTDAQVQLTITDARGNTLVSAFALANGGSGNVYTGATPAAFTPRQNFPWKVVIVTYDNAGVTKRDTSLFEGYPSLDL